MPFVTTKEILLKAQKEGYAVGAFNVENMEMAQAVLWAAEEAKAPVIMQTTSSTLNYADPAMYLGMIKEMAQRASVPVALHLDHGNSFNLAMKVLRYGYSSVMFDGSHLSFEENIRQSKQIVEVAHPMGIPVEGELGRVGGKEDDLEAQGGDLTDADMAADFVQKTGIDSLAVAIGTAHGIYSKPPVLNIEQLEKISKKVEVPLVLHGASGLTDGDITKCVRRGIAKINFATELRIAYSQGVKQALAEDSTIIDPKAYGKRGREMVKALVLNRIKICGSVNKSGQ